MIVDLDWPDWQESISLDDLEQQHADAFEAAALAMHAHVDAVFAQARAQAEHDIKGFRNEDGRAFDAKAIARMLFVVDQHHRAKRHEAHVQLELQLQASRERSAGTLAMVERHVDEATQH